MFIIAWSLNMWRTILKNHLKITFLFTLLLFALLIIACNQNHYNSTHFDEALKNGRLANEGFKRCNYFVKDWLKYADPVSGLIPENLEKGIDRWSPKHSAADNYPFMVLTSFITDSSLFNGTMLNILKNEIELTSRLGSLSDTYSFANKDFAYENVDIERIIFGASEYVKDGLLPLIELLGESPWSERMIDLIDDTWANALIETKYGLIPSKNVEVNGEQLQILSRVYWMTGDEKYLNWALRLGDYYLLDNQHPTRDFEKLRLRDHGCEIISGLCELYATVHYALPKKKVEYQKPIHEILHHILEIGINSDGMFYSSVNPKSGKIVDKRIADTWGYTYNGFYTVYLLDKTERYRDALLYVFSNLDNYRNFNWESGSSDGFADAIESALNLYNREPLSQVNRWIESEIKVMWSLQDSSYRENAQKWKNTGIIEGWHGDGNFARTTIMYCLWKTQGITISPWRDDIVFGAVFENDKLFISIKSEAEWEGIVKFDTQRHKDVMKLPIDWPRINQFPEWYTIKPHLEYKIKNINTDSSEKYNGSNLMEGVFIKLDPKINHRLVVTEL